MRQISRLKTFLYEILWDRHENHKLQSLFNFFMIALIVLNIISVILETVPEYYASCRSLFTVFEWFSIIIFTIEYGLRLWVCTRNPKFRHPLLGRLKFAVSFMALVDLLAFLPGYPHLLLKQGSFYDVRFIRILRLFRLLRIVKMGRYSHAMQMFSRAINSVKEELLLSFFVVIVALVLLSSLVYEAEKEDNGAQFTSIPHAMWWGVATLTTIGYGDIYPKSNAGMFLAALFAILGIGLFALPAGIIASGFVEELQKHRRKKKCPHCGKEL